MYRYIVDLLENTGDSRRFMKFMMYSRHLNINPKRKNNNLHKPSELWLGQDLVRYRIGVVIYELEEGSWSQELYST